MRARVRPLRSRSGARGSGAVNPLVDRVGLRVLGLGIEWSRAVLLGASLLTVQLGFDQVDDFVLDRAGARDRQALALPQHARDVLVADHDWQRFAFALALQKQLDA